ncbi:MAG: sigma-54 dependent transcriptional regulator [Rikenellaceae bacterium]|nr:sigma-54 dependent transcriptional regulator [Rikenellaceae bacterium]MCL2692808.1 sigma-54 dependent transcriptional regulator [Rikenellaceae bacterium]
MDIRKVKQRFGIVGSDEALDRALEVALRVAPTDLSVLVTGESGVGKEFFPQIIHAYSARKHSKYIAVNCGAIPEGTIESELFGHEKGAFTGAAEARKGYFEEADGGTIFLDEVAELPLSTQVRLLRVLQDGEYIRVGSSKIRRTDVRVVAATNIDLPAAIVKGRFREDLYYRLNTVPIHVPALRERREDIALLFRKFATDIAAQYRMPAISLYNEAREVLENYSWPGNVRQLKNVAEQISAVEQKRTITAAILLKYLPRIPSSPVAVTASRAAGGDTGGEREMLYKVLFDVWADIGEMRAGIDELRRMVLEVRAERGEGRNSEPREIAGLLPEVAGRSAVVQPAITENDAEFTDSEEVADEEPAREMTKEQAQREQIIRALRRNNGRRKDAARELFISERTLYRKIKELGIDHARGVSSLPDDNIR